MLNRRQFAYSAGAGLLLAPFASFLQRRPLRAAGSKRAKRLFLFCTMGTKPELWSPTGVSGENSFTFSPATAPLAAHKDSIVLIEGLPSGNPDDASSFPSRTARPSACNARGGADRSGSWSFVISRVDHGSCADAAETDR